MIIDTTLDGQKAVRKDGFYKKLNQKDQHYADVGRNIPSPHFASQPAPQRILKDTLVIVWGERNQHETSGMNARDEISSDVTLLSAFTPTTAAVHAFSGRSRKGWRTACRRKES
jgi:hypothetical protein